MKTHHYVAHGTTEDMVVVRVDPKDNLQRLVTAGLGVALLWHGVRRPGWLSALSLMAGAELLARSCAGRSMKELLPETVKKALPKLDAPSFRDEGVPASQEPIDDVEAASMASFPASDAPSSF